MLPTRLLIWLLQRFLGRDAAAAVIGDLHEEFAERQPADGGGTLAGFGFSLRLLAATGAAIPTRARRLADATTGVVRDALRSLQAAPRHAAIVVLVLTAGIAFGTVTFSVVDAVFLKPLPFEHSERVLTISAVDQKFQPLMTAASLARLRDQTRGIESISPWLLGIGLPVTVNSQTDGQAVLYTDAEVFRVFRFSPEVGRFWSRDEEARGDDVAVLGYRYWQARFSGVRTVIGSHILIGRRTYTVIGILPAATDHPELTMTSAAVWVPIGRDAIRSLIARAKPGTRLNQVVDEVASAANVPGWRPEVRRLLDSYIEDVRLFMQVALGLAALVILIACANAANLMLTRAVDRSEELAIRSALGASARRVVVSVLAEGILLSATATLCAILGSLAGVRAAKLAILSVWPWMFRASTIAVNGRVLVAAAACALVTGVVCAGAPAWHASRLSLSTVLTDAGTRSSTGRRRWRSVFLVAEVAAAAIALVMSWLFVASLVNVYRVDLGIDLRNLIAVNPRLEYQAPVDVVQQLVASVPGVQGVAVSRGAGLPVIGRAFGAAWITSNLEAVDPEASGRGVPMKTLQYRVTRNYFDVAGLSFQRGQTWSSDGVGGVIVLDDQAARRLFGEADAYGKAVRMSGGADVYTVIGTVHHVRAQGPEDADLPTAYLPLKPDPARMFAVMLVRTSAPPAQVLPAINAALDAVAPIPREPFVFVAGEALSRITAPRQVSAALVAVLGIVGVVLGAVGVYSVMMAFVAHRTRELGIRVALGATPARLRSGVVWLACRHLLAGLGVGLPLAWFLARGLGAMLFGITSEDGVVYVGVSVLLGLVALTAAWWPATRAAGTDPMLTLRR